jgi:hypothetical protein
MQEIRTALVRLSRSFKRNQASVAVKSAIKSAFKSEPARKKSQSQHLLALLRVHFVPTLT